MGAGATGQAKCQQSRMPGSADPNDALTLGLEAMARGEEGALQRVLPLVYARLKGMAEERMKGERSGHTLQPTALVHEAFLKISAGAVPWNGEAHFFAVAALAMRRVLIDHARGRGRETRGGGRMKMRLEDADAAARPERELDLLDLDEALVRLAEHDGLGARIVEMRFFAGMEVEAIAGVLGVTDRTVRRHWVYAKAWLAREMNGGAEAGG
jgi:RNA polymerase sigma factor (TIGR02999 family)